MDIISILFGAIVFGILISIIILPTYIIQNLKKKREYKKIFKKRISLGRCSIIFIWDNVANWDHDCYFFVYKFR